MQNNVGDILCVQNNVVDILLVQNIVVDILLVQNNVFLKIFFLLVFSTIFTITILRTESGWVSNSWPLEPCVVAASSRHRSLTSSVDLQPACWP